MLWIRNHLGRIRILSYPDPDRSTKYLANLCLHNGTATAGLLKHFEDFVRKDVYKQRRIGPFFRKTFKIIKIVLFKRYNQNPDPIWPICFGSDRIRIYNTASTLRIILNFFCLYIHLLFCAYPAGQARVFSREK